jgi:Zn finger protein HypA/HybF involved in hydrogenase expression
VFTRSRAAGEPLQAAAGAFFCCPACSHAPLTEQPDALACPACGRAWAIREGIYDFRNPI